MTRSWVILWFVPKLLITERALTLETEALGASAYGPPELPAMHHFLDPIGLKSIYLHLIP